MDDAKQLMPEYLRFVRGVIDSNDLPLNVSREILQQSRVVETIRTASVKRVLGLLDDLAAHHAEKYATFWKEFGRAFKEGIVEDTANKDRIAALLRFATHARRPRGADRVARRLRRPDEGRLRTRSTTSPPMASLPPCTARISRSSGRAASRCC